MAYTTIDNPELYFQTKLYAGTGSSGSHTLDGDTDMQPNMIWFKSRSAAESHLLVDSVRGSTKRIRPDTSNAEDDQGDYGIQSFNSDGFTTGTGDNNNKNGDNYVAWNWKAGTSVSGTTTGGTGKAYSGSVNTDAGISLITYLGNDNSAHVIPHHLGVAPELTIIKERSNVDIWVVQSSHLGIGNYMTLHTTSASATNGGNFITAVSSSTVTMNENAVNNANDQAYMLYSFVSKQGYSKVGTYVGNGSASSGTFVYTGFKPAFIMWKGTASTQNWMLVDNKRDVSNLSNGLNDVAFPNSSQVPNDGETFLDVLSNGFKIRTTETGVNASGEVHIYMAFAENPFVTSTGVPATAR